MSTPAGPVAADGLLLPAEKLRRAAGDLCVTLAVMAFMLILEVVSVFVWAVLLAGGGMASMGLPGVAGYVVLPVVAGVLTLPLFIGSLRQPALRIDTTGISRVLRHRVDTAPWAILDSVQFTQNRRVLVLLVRAGATFPGKIGVLNRPASLPYYTLGNTLRRRRRRKHHDLVIAAVERFAPGTYNVEPFHIRKVRKTAAAEQRLP